MSENDSKATRRELTANERSRIAGAFLCHVKQVDIAEWLGIPKSTVYATIKRLRETGSEHPEKRQGPENALSERDERALARIVAADRSQPLNLITSKLNAAVGMHLTSQTVRKYIKKANWQSCFACKKPYLTKKAAANRLEWARNHHNWDEEWKSVVFTDESRFCLFNSDGRPRVWRKANEKFHRACIKPTTKFGGGSVMFWGCFSWWGVGPLVLVDTTMDSDEYVNTLSRHFLPWAKDTMDTQTGGTQLIFQQDLASVHTSGYSSWWMETHGFDVLEWAPHSPDLNPIENLWHHLDTQVRRRNPLPLKKGELVEAVQEEWEKLPIQYLRALIGSMSRRVQAVIDAKGWHTKY
jgi:transposase